jgi:hypothetical protein
MFLLVPRSRVGPNKETIFRESRMNPGWKVDEMNQTRFNSTPIHPEFIAISFIGCAASHKVHLLRR